MGRLAAFLAFVVCAAAAQAGEQRPPALPEAREVAAHVSDQWPIWQARFALFAGRKGEAATLVRVESVTCGTYSGWWIDCDVLVTGRFDDGSPVTRNLPTMFDRNADGRLEEVIVLSHTRPALPEVAPAQVPPTGLHE